MMMIEEVVIIIIEKGVMMMTEQAVMFMIEDIIKEVQEEEEEFITMCQYLQRPVSLYHVRLLVTGGSCISMPSLFRPSDSIIPCTTQRKKSGPPEIRHVNLQALLKSRRLMQLSFTSYL